MKKIFSLLFILIALATTLQAQTTGTFNRVIAKDGIKLGGVWRSSWPSGGGGGTGSGDSTKSWSLYGNTVTTNPYIGPKNNFSFNIQANSKLLLQVNPDSTVKVKTRILPADSSEQAATTKWVKKDVEKILLFDSTFDITQVNAKTIALHVNTSNMASNTYVNSLFNSVTTFDGWATTGNNGTDSTTNFAGTKDNTPFILKANNQPYLKMGTNVTLATKDIVIDSIAKGGGDVDSRALRFKAYSPGGVEQGATIAFDGDAGNGGLVLSTAGTIVLNGSSLLVPNVTSSLTGLSLYTNSTTNGFLLQNTYNQTSGNLFQLRNNTTTTVLNIPAATGNVGIGEPAPTARLHVTAADSNALKITAPLSNTVLLTDSLAIIGADGNFKKAAKGSTGTSGGVNYALQTTAPTDTTKFWLDNSTGVNGVWPLKQRILGVWRTVQWYDPIANFLSAKRPLFVLGTGQSNMIYRTTGGDLAVDNRVIEWIQGGSSWAIANRVAGNANNIALQFAKQVAKKENRVVRFVVIAEISKPIEDWYPAATKTNEITAVIRAAQIDSFDVILLRQGEQNATLLNTEQQYSAKVDTVFKAYRDSTWFGKSGRAMLGGLNESYINTGVFDYYYHLNNGSRGGVGYTAVDMLGLSRVNGIHISGASIDTVGARYYEAYAGKPTQYSLEKTPNVGWISNTELGFLPDGTNFPTIRLQQSTANGRRGGALKYDNVTSNLLITTNGVNNGAVSADSIGIAVNEFGQVGINKINGTLTSNLSAFNISTYKAIAFSITNPGTNTANLQIDAFGRFVNKPINVYSRFSPTGDIIIHSQSGDVNNGVIRFSRVNLSGTIIPSYNGFYQYFNGSANLFHIGAHGSTDTTAANDVPILTFDQSARGVSIKKGTIATAYLDIAASTGGANTAPIKLTAGTVLGTPANGAIEFDGTNYFVTQGSTRYFLAQTLTGTAAPATTPAAVGIHFIDTTNKKEYVSTGTASSADWTILN
jgi:hypothetical protein